VTKKKVLSHWHLVDSGFIEALDVDKLDPDDALERVTVQRRQLSIAVFDDSAPLDCDQRRTRRRRLVVRQAQRHFFCRHFPTEENDLTPIS